MASLYPGGYDSFTQPGEFLDDPAHDQLHIELIDAVEAVQTELGLNPRGSFASVRARLDFLEGRVTTTVATGFTPADGWSLDAAFGYRIGNIVMLRVTVTRTGGTIVVPPSGNIANMTIATAPSALRGTIGWSIPLVSGVTGRVAAGSYWPSNGQVTLGALAAGGIDLTNGESIELGGTVIVA